MEDSKYPSSLNANFSPASLLSSWFQPIKGIKKEMSFK
jgi:hypothetical protein